MKTVIGCIYVYLAEDSGEDPNDKSNVSETDNQDEAMNPEDNSFLHLTANEGDE